MGALPDPCFSALEARLWVSMVWGLRDPFCLWAAFPSASHLGLQGLRQGMGRVWRGGDLGEGRGRRPSPRQTGQEATDGAGGGCGHLLGRQGLMGKSRQVS